MYSCKPLTILVNPTELQQQSFTPHSGSSLGQGRIFLPQLFFLILLQIELLLIISIIIIIIVWSFND